MRQNDLFETLKGFSGWRTLSGLRRILLCDPRVLRFASNPGLKISQRLRRYRLKLANAFGVTAAENSERLRRLVRNLI
jgi:hypothetical protein